MLFEWDDNKNIKNKKKHKISFEVAKLVFEDPLAYSKPDEFVQDEERYNTLGMVGNVVLFVVHTYRFQAGKEVIRLISARKATSYERRLYEESGQ